MKKLSRGRMFRIGLFLASPYACNGNVLLGDKGLTASGGSLAEQVGGTSNQGETSQLSSGLGGTPAPSGGTATLSTGGRSSATTASTGDGNATGGSSIIAVATGGAPVATGGNPSEMGGSVTTGGARAEGGARATGGISSGAGAAPLGGVQSTGGTPATGGATTATTAPALACITSASNAYWKVTAVTTASTATPDVTVNDTASSGQTWEGFGGCFNERGWYYLTTQAMKDQAMALLFGEDGANFAWGRIPIGASDYAMDRYTLDDTATPNDPTPNAETNRPPADTAMANFKIDRDKEQLIPYIQAAQKVKPDIRFWASPWTPPVWMKSGYKTNSGADTNRPAIRPSFFDGGTYNGAAANMTAYAQYYTNWVQAYHDSGIDIEYVSPQNEPGYDQNYPSCLWDKATYVTWVKTLAQSMSALNVKVMLGTLSNAGDNGRNDLDIASAVLADPAAKSAVSVVGVQWGVLDRVNSGSTFQGLPIWATEHKCGNYPWQTSTYNNTQAPNDLSYAVESWGYIRDAINKGKVTAYNAWNMVLDRTGLGIDTTRDWKQNALLVADSGAIKITPTYYVFRHFSQFVKPGAKVLSATGGDVVAFKNPDNSVVAVMYNSGAAKQYTVKIGQNLLQFSMPGAGWATVVSP